jgi:hypothetical protein
MHVDALSLTGTRPHLATAQVRLSNGTQESAERLLSHCRGHALIIAIIGCVLRAQLRDSGAVGEEQQLADWKEVAEKLSDLVPEHTPPVNIYETTVCAAIQLSRQQLGKEGSALLEAYIAVEVHVWPHSEKNIKYRKVWLRAMIGWRSPACRPLVV